MLHAVLYAVLLGTAYAAAQGSAAMPRNPSGRWPVATIAALLVVGVPTAVQLTVAPWLLADLERNWTAVRAGQGWRLVTSLVVQDGGLSGAAFNLVSLAVIGVVAERVWGAGRWCAVALAAGVGAQLWGALVQPVGGGNSVAVFGLAASIALAAVRRGPGASRLLGLVTLLTTATLLALGDIHGGAALIGGVLGALLRVPDAAGVRQV